MLRFNWAFVIMGLIACLTTFALTAKYKDNYYNNLINAEKAAAALDLQEATLKTIEIERRYNEVSQSLEIKNAENVQKLDKIYADNKRLARELGGLRDPGKSPHCADGLPSTTDASGKLDENFEGARLSEAASEFLLALAREADGAAQDRNLCQEWILKTR
tara:strand:- start:125 stop:607 length:483 start_codon:yes stop_codon:yes gene_type:complete